MLLKMLRKTEEAHKISDICRIRFIETSGRKYIDQLKVTDPFQKQCAPCVNCLSCRYSKSATNCRVANVGYSITCKLCKDRKIEQIYIGETCRNIYIRGKEHQNLLEKKSEKSVMYKHIKEKHSDEENKVKFDMRISGRLKNPMTRQLDEAI